MSITNFITEFLQLKELNLYFFLLFSKTINSIA